MKLKTSKSRRNVTVGVELPLPPDKDGVVPGAVFIPLGVVPRNTSKYKPHQGAREKARRLKHQEK